MKLYRMFGGLQYRGSMFPPFIESQWTPSKKEALKAYQAATYADFKKSDPDSLFRAKCDQLPQSLEKPSPETCFLWVEFAEVSLDRKALDHLWGETKYPPNDLIIELADYDQKTISERGICMNGRKMSDKTFKSILYP